MTVTTQKQLAYVEVATAVTTTTIPPTMAVDEEGPPEPTVVDPGRAVSSEWQRRWPAPYLLPLIAASARHLIQDPSALPRPTPWTIVRGGATTNAATGYVS